MWVGAQLPQHAAALPAFSGLPTQQVVGLTLYYNESAQACKVLGVNSM